MTTVLERIDADLIEPQRLAGCVIDELRSDRRRPPAKQRGGISAREALKALQFEAMVVMVSAEQLSIGKPLSDPDKARLVVAFSRIGTIASEAGS